MLGLSGLRLYGAIGAALALLALLGTVKVQHGTIGKLRTENGTLTAQREQALSANQSQSATIDQLEQSNAQWLSLGKGVKELAANLKELDEAKAERAVLQAKLNERWKHVSAQCQTWMDSDFTAICADVDSSLRDYAKAR